MRTTLLSLQLKKTLFSARLFSSSAARPSTHAPENSDVESAVYRRALKLQRPTTVSYRDYLQSVGYLENLHNFVSLIGAIDYPLKACSAAVGFGVYTLLRVRAPNRDLVMLLKFRKEMAEISVQHLKAHDLVYVSGRLQSYLKLAEDGSSVRCYEVDVKEMNFVAQNVPELACQNLVKLEPKVSLEQKRRDRLHLWQVFFANPSEWWDNRNSKLKGRAPDFRHKDTGEALWIQDNDPPWVNQQLQLHDSRLSKQSYRRDKGLVSLVPFGL
ncbi:protein OSB1, mitochondrial-like isoform X2 [Salvia miltiorrhiza]|uniref:protein OSB1, mitochondrial-like isoform X2 n=1 Tax=Salvia miltiorrhiza TaxID=226208 RepID=UPI0025AC3A80|nr:protein OSB1, mitochondrial-like isoform X2 [Salvia miltiorrhiza]